MRLRVQGHPALAAIVKALRETYEHLHAGGAAADLTSPTVTVEEMAALMHDKRYQEGRREYLSVDPHAG